MIVLKLEDESSYAACDELTLSYLDQPGDPAPRDPGDADGLVITMQHVKMRKGMRQHLVDRKLDPEAERDVVAHMHNRIVRFNGLQIEQRLRDQTRCSCTGFEVVT